MKPTKTPQKAIKLSLKRFLFLTLPLAILTLNMASCQSTVKKLNPEIINVYPHDSAAFTQGLLYYDGKLYESTGLNGSSSLREVEVETGKVLRLFPLDDQFFAEGLERVNDKLIQITWRSGVAFLYDLKTFERQKVFNYDGEGWGICYDGEYLYMSDGSTKLFKRDPESFELISSVTVEQNGNAIRDLNELECIGDFIYANVWHTDRILKINKDSGNVVAEIDASNLLTPEQRRALNREAVLNGIAYNAETENFYITGKLWPKLFEVKFK